MMETRELDGDAGPRWCHDCRISATGAFTWLFVCAPHLESVLYLELGRRVQMQNNNTLALVDAERPGQSATPISITTTNNDF